MKGMRYLKIYEIIDSEYRRSVGVLLYYEKIKDFIIELKDDLDEWSAPLLFTNLVKNNEYTASRTLSYLWVKERIIPNTRQNIGSILKTHNMESYDEMEFLELSSGICSQDSLFIKRIDELPEYVLERNKKNLKECIPCDDNEVLCFFNDDSVKKINLNSISYVEGVNKILKNELLFQSGKLGTGGYFMTFNDSIDIPSYIFYDRGKNVSLTLKDFIDFSKKNLIDTSSVCDIQECTRQNISYLVKKQELKPIKDSVRGNLFVKGDILRNIW